MSKCIMIVGATGAGKTYFTKKLISNVNKNALIVFDVNDEYGDLYPYPFNPDMDAFLTKAEKVEKAVILIEDATSFFAVQGRSDKLIKILVAKRHTQNTIILLFHSWGDVPRYLYRKCTEVVIFKTLDSEKDVLKVGNQQIFEAWQRVQAEARTSKFFSTYPPPPGEAPPMEIVKLY